MTDLIPQDLIEFIAVNRPEVLPGRIMIPYNGDCRLCLISADNTDNYPDELSDSHAAALLEHWLKEQLTNEKLEIIGLPSDKPGWEVYLNWSTPKEVSVYADDYLSALWEAYKKEKKMQ